MSNTLDASVSSYTPAFAHYEENRIVHLAYGQGIAEHVRQSGARSVLSLGIGHREVARSLVACLSDGRLDRYAIVDASPDLVRAFEVEFSPLPDGLELIEGWFESFSTDGSFDVIEAGFVLEHVDSPDQVLERMHDFAAPGGRMFIAVPNARSLHRLIGQQAGLLADPYALSDADLQLGHQRYFDLTSLRSLVESTGWRVIRTRGMLLKPFTTGQLNQLKLSPAVWQALQTMADGYPEISNAIQMEVVSAR